MKQILALLTLTLSLNSFCQTLKTFNGTFNDGLLQNGNASYTYYEDPNTHEYLKQGAFSYTFKGKGDYSGFDRTITGSFNKGLKNGVWTYIITMTDFGQQNPYYTETIILTANYKNGYADGNWKEVRSAKKREKYFVYGQYKWEPFDALKTMTINMNFKNGKLIGAVNINDEFAKFKAIGSYDNNSLCIGTWMINDMAWGKNHELIYKDNLLYDYIARGNNGEVLEASTKYQYDYDNLVKAKAMTQKEKEEAGLSIDTVCGGDLCAATYNIKDYFPKLFSVDYFLYKFIGGDLSYKEGFQGGCNLRVTTTNYTSSANSTFLKEADDFYNKNDLIQAYEHYISIDLMTIKPSERNAITDKISLIKPKVSELIKARNDEQAKIDSSAKADKQAKIEEQTKKQNQEELISTRQQEISKKHSEFEKHYVEHQEIRSIIDGKPLTVSTYPKGKQIYEKGEKVYQEKTTLLHSEKDNDKILAMENDILRLLDKLISLASTDTKDLNKQLKKAESSEDINKVLGL